MKTILVALTLVALLWKVPGAQDADASSAVKIVRKGEGYQLLRNSQP